MKTIIKCLAWMAALFAVALAMIYCFYLILIFMLFEYEIQMWLSIAALVLLFAAYWKLVSIAEC